MDEFFEFYLQVFYIQKHIIKIFTYTIFFLKKILLNPLGVKYP